CPHVPVERAGNIQACRLGWPDRSRTCAIRAGIIFSRARYSPPTMHTVIKLLSAMQPVVSPLIRFSLVEFRKVFRYRENTRFAVKVNSIGGVRGKFHFARFGAKPGDDVSHRTPAMELLDQRYSVCGIAPDRQLVHSTAKQLFARITVPALKSRIEFYKAALVQGCNGERNGARTKHFLKLVVGDSTLPLPLRQRGFGFMKVD